MIEFTVQNMTCEHCVRAVSEAIGSVDPQAGVEVDLRTGRVRVEARSASGPIIGALQQAGYPALLADAPATAASARRACSGG
jgi:copper chaperone